MSKERELLVRCRAAINIRYDQVMLIRLHHEIETLLGEVEELLDQPEQEPVAWCWEEQFGVIMNDWGLVSSIHKPKESKYRKNIHPLYMSPQKVEQEPVAVGYIYKQKDCYGLIETVFNVDKPHITWHNVTDVTPVYTAPPKRETLSEEESLQAAIKLYETEDGLDYPEGFVDGLKYAEKMHGIGGGE